MNEPKTKSIAKRIGQDLKDQTNGPEHLAALYRALGEELGLAHHLRPASVAALFDRPDLPIIAPEMFRDRTDRKEKAIGFIKRVYSPWLGHGLTRSHIMELDKPLYVALKNHIYYHGAAEGLDLPTKAEQIDRDFVKLAGFDDPASRDALDQEIIALRRIHHLLESRDRSRKGKSPH